jgi:hypothetical protein
MRFLSYLTTLFAITLLVACGGGGGSPGATTSTALFTTAPSTLTIGVGSSQSFNVGGGVGPYSAVSSNNAVVASSVSGNTLTLVGNSPGSVTVTLRDANGTTQALSITVAAGQALSTGIPSGLVLAVGAGNSQTFTVTGGVGPYQALSTNTAVMTASLSGNKVTVTGLAAGSANLVVTDATNTSVSSTVSVSATPGQALFTTAPSALTVSRGTSPSFSIGGGVGPYTATSSNTGVLTVSLTGSTFTLTPVGNGAATVVVRDAAGSTVSIATTVASAPITLNPTAYSAFVGDVLYSVIQGGVGPYSAISGFPDVADVDIGTVTAGVFTANPNGNIVRIRVKQAVGSGNIIVSDSTGSTANITLTASAATNAINLSPKALSVGEAFGGTIQLMLYGATGTTNIFSTHPGVISVTTPVTGSPTGTPVTLTKAAGNVCGGNLDVIITAVDAGGAVGTSTITVVNSSGDACPP